MQIGKYFQTITNLIEQFSRSGLILGTEIITDIRTENEGIIKGRITFQDESCLHFTEYVHTGTFIEKLSYSFHYQTVLDSMIFRYDNAPHKPTLKFDYHKHLSNGMIIKTDVPELEFILTEIVGTLIIRR